MRLAEVINELLILVDKQHDMRFTGDCIGLSLIENRD